MLLLSGLGLLVFIRALHLLQGFQNLVGVSLRLSNSYLQGFENLAGNLNT